MNHAIEQLQSRESELETSIKTDERLLGYVKDLITLHKTRIEENTKALKEVRDAIAVLEMREEVK